MKDHALCHSGGSRVREQKRAPGEARLTFGAEARALELLAIAAILLAPGHSQGVLERRAFTSLWPRSAVPAIRDAGPDRPVELGVKFRSDVPGDVVGIRFFKVPANSGRHPVSLWTEGGELLARGSPVAETASGWQRVDFAKPVAVEPGRLYVASYHAPAGHFSVDHDFFASRGVDQLPLHVPADRVEGANGVFAYGPAGTFPTQGHRSSNYWVDVVFRPSAKPATVLLSIEVSPGHAAVALGDSQALTAAGRYGDGSSRDITALVEWMSDDEAAVTVSGGGVAKASGVGATSVRARLGSVSGVAAVVTVSPTTSGEPPPASGGPSDLSIATAVLPDGMQGVAYSAPLLASGGTLPYRWAVAGLAPPGLGLDATGAVIGKPALAGSFHFRAEVTDAAGRSATGTMRLAVGPASFSIWPRSVVVVTNQTAPEQVSEAGVRFRSDVAGYVTAIRFHRDADSPGPRVVHLWTGDGELLAEATSGVARGRGWHEVPLPRPIAVAAGAAYVASFRVEAGLRVTQGSFGQGVSNPPLRVNVGTPADVGGVFAYGPPGTFPTEAYGSANPWVDVVLVPSAVPPALVSIRVSPPDPELELGEPRTFRAIGVDSRGGESDVTRVAEWESSDAATVHVAADGVATGLRAGEARVLATVRGVTGATSATVRDLPPAPDEGPGGPILVVTGSANGFSRYLAEILRAEGLNEFLATDISRVDEGVLARHDLVILGDFPLTDAQADMIAGWVRNGGNLIAMRPDPKLAPLLGLRQVAGTLSDGYLEVSKEPGPGTGITTRSMQFHGTADLYELDGARAIAGLRRDGKQRTGHAAMTGHAAITLRRAAQGQAAAFAYDLARSVVYTRQGNPAWSRQPRSGGVPRRPHDLFYGPAPFDSRPDWVDFSRIDIPQADEQQGLLVNLVLQMNQAKKPLPRFWYLPSGHRAVVVMTSDDHGSPGPKRRLEAFLARSRPGCSVEGWECVRSTAYVYASGLLTAEEAQRYASLGFEISLHATTECADFESRADLDALYASQLSAFALNYPGLPRPRTTRTHCVAWSDYEAQPRVQATHGIRLDTNYYYWPASWVRGRPGYMTGSALPMRFADRVGRVIDVFQVATQMTDESGQAYPSTIDAFLDSALGPPGHYGVFTANMHTDQPASSGADVILASAQARKVPVISARQLLDWLEARNESSFSSLKWERGVLSFAIRVAPGARDLRAMLPLRVGAAELVSVMHGPSRVSFAVKAVKGMRYAVFPAAPGEYRAAYR